MPKITADPENCLWFYHDGHRYGEIVKRYSENLLTIRTCDNTKHRVKKSKTGKWISVSSKNFKEEKHIRKEKKNEKRKKTTGEKRFKVKIKKRKVRKSGRKTKDE